VEESGEGTSLMHAWEGSTCVLIVDAVRSGRPPGTLERIDVSSGRIPKTVSPFSSHAFGVAEAVEMGRELQKLPPKVCLYGIEGESFEAGVGLSEEVVRSLPHLLSMIELDLKVAIAYYGATQSEESTHRREV
jgi:hydrogenase maturation protease